MKNTIWTMIGIILLSQFSYAGEGGASVHGGSAIVCSSANGDLTSVELTDLFRARMRNTKLLPSNRAEYEYLQIAISQLKNADSAFAYRVKELLSEISSMMFYVPTAQKMKVIEDLGPRPPVTEHCSIEALGVFHDGMLVVAKPYYDKLLPIDRAAFLLHEAIYAVERSYSLWPGNSVRTQELVGLLLSEVADATRARALIKRMTYEFVEGGYRVTSPVWSDGCFYRVSFAGSDRAELGVVAQQDLLNTRRPCPRLYQKTLKLNVWTGAYFDLASGVTFKFGAEGTLQVSGYRSEFKVTSDFPRL